MFSDFLTVLVQLSGPEVIPFRENIVPGSLGSRARILKIPPTFSTILVLGRVGRQSLPTSLTSVLVIH